MGRQETSLACLSLLGLPGCQVCSLCASRLPSAPLPKSPVECRDGAVQGATGHVSWQRQVVVAAMRRSARIGQPEGSGEYRRRERGKNGRRQQGRKPKKVGWHQRAGVGDWEMVSSPWVSINSCLGVGLCALCFSSYCLGIPVGTLPAPMLGSHRHPSHSDQRRKGTSVE